MNTIALKMVIELKNPSEMVIKERIIALPIPNMPLAALAVIKIRSSLLNAR